MKNTAGMTLTLTRHACKQAAQKGFTAEDIQDAFENPTKVYPSGSHPGQYRIVNGKVCIVGEPKGDKFVGITMYADSVLTPPRGDQLKTKEGQRYADRYSKGLGRG